MKITLRTNQKSTGQNYLKDSSQIIQRYSDKGLNINVQQLSESIRYQSSYYVELKQIDQAKMELDLIFERAKSNIENLEITDPKIVKMYSLNIINQMQQQSKQQQQQFSKKIKNLASKPNRGFEDLLGDLVFLSSKQNKYKKEIGDLLENRDLNKLQMKETVHKICPTSEELYKIFYNQWLFYSQCLKLEIQFKRQREQKYQQQYQYQHHLDWMKIALDSYYKLIEMSSQFVSSAKMHQQNFGYKDKVINISLLRL